MAKDYPDDWDAKYTDPQLRLRLKDATVVYTDMFAIKYGFVANHTKYGMNNSIKKCQW